MTSQPAIGKPARLTFERRYEASLEDVWDLWATPEGFASWWEPEGIRVVVHAFDLRVGGTLHEESIAEGAEEIAYMKAAGRPLTQEIRGTFVEVVPQRRLTIRFTIDFLPGVEPYPYDMSVELIPEGTGVRMVCTIDRHPDAEMTRLAVLGFESSLRKLAAAVERALAAADR